MNFNDLKSTNAALFPLSGGSPSWKLNVLQNAWNIAIDYLAILWAWFGRAEETASVTVGASPFIHVAGDDSEVLYIGGGSISAVEKRNAGGSWVQVLAGSGTVFLAGAQECRVTYSSLPTIKRDVVGMFVNAAGNIATLTPDASPWTIENEMNRTVVLYISGGSVSSITRNGVSLTDALPLSVALPPGGAVTIAYSSAPTVVLDS